jgi:diguanylate cyclase (GGDEF)-like protein
VPSENPSQILRNASARIVGGAFVAAAVYAALQWSYVSPRAIVAFLLAQAAVCMGLTIAASAARRGSTMVSPTVERVLAVAHGLAWGSSPLYLWPTAIHPQHRWLLPLVLLAGAGVEAADTRAPQEVFVLRSVSAWVPFAAHAALTSGISLLDGATAALAACVLAAGIENRKRTTSATALHAEVANLQARLATTTEETERAVRAAQEASTRDELTGAHTKKFLLDSMTKQIADGRPFVVAFTSVDGVIDVRSRFGKPVLHEVIRRIANSARTAFRDCDVVAYFGDGTFAVLIKDAPLEAAMMRSDQFRQNVESIILRDHPELQPTICVGVTEHLAHHNVDDVMVRGERALQAAKLAGRNRVMFWQEAEA